MSLFSYNAPSKTTSTGMKYEFGVGQSSTKSNKDGTPSVSTTSTNSTKDSYFDYAPKRFGVRYDPPTIILEYLQPSSGKLYHHKMKMLNLKPTTSNEEVIETLKKKHSMYFASNKISEKQLINLIEKIKKRMPNQDSSDNKKGGSTLTLGSKTMSNFNSSSYKPSSFDKDSSANNTSKPLTLNLNNNTNTFANKEQQGLKKISSSVDKPAKKLWEKEEENFNSRPKTSQGSKNLQPGADKGKTNTFWDVDDEEEDDAKALDYNTVNLNKLSTEELQKHKKKMDVLFSKNQKKPGDPGFVYDVQKDFTPHEDNEWDEEM